MDTKGGTRSGMNWEVGIDINALLCTKRGFPSGSAVANSPAAQETKETQVRSLGQEDPLEKGMATHSSILAWEIPWTEEPGGLMSIGFQRVGHNRATEYAHMLLKQNK